jgi:hypothetical protein
MAALASLALAFFLAAGQITAAYAQDNAATVVSQGLVPFASDEGLARLSRSDARVNFPALANQFEAEYNGAFCGLASAAIVLNAVKGREPDLPRDQSRFRADDLKYLPAGVELGLPRFTQDNVFDKGPKTRAQVFGEPVTIDGKQVQDFGFQLRQLDALLKANGLDTRLVIVDDSKPADDIRMELVENLKRRGDYAIVNYQRKAVGQQGFAHIAPLGAYDDRSDSFLVLDVNPASASWVWMPTATLVKGMRTFDTVENRGYILVETR